MPVNKRRMGALGEHMAADFIVKKGFLILAKNYRCRQGEIDMIAKDKQTIVFIEVKYRKNLQYGTPSESVHYHKQRKIMEVSQYFLYENNLFDSEIRYDVIEIYEKNNFPVLHHIENAFWLS